MARAEIAGLALAVLKLVDERPRHPYEIQQLARARSYDHLFKLRTGSLYHAVERLTRDGLIEPVGTSRSGWHPARTLYAITAEGRSVLSERVADMVANPVREYPVYRLAIALATTLNRNVLIDALRRRLERLDRMIAAEALAFDAGEQRALRARSLSQHYHLTMHRAERDWTAQVLTDVESGASDWPGEQGVGEAAPSAKDVDR